MRKRGMEDERKGGRMRKRGREDERKSEGG